MAKQRSDTIALLGKPIFKEGIASVAINPGYLLEFGGTKDLQPHSTASVNCRRAFALENTVIGKDIDDQYPINDNVIYGSFHSGQEVQAKLAAGAAAIVKGDSLESNGDGTLKKGSSGVTIAYALESKDNSSGTNEVFIPTEVV